MTRRDAASIIVRAMVAVPSSSAGGVGAARAGDPRLWRACVGAWLILCLVFLVVPAEHELLRNGIVYPLTEASAIAAIVYGVRRYRPDSPSAWLLIAGGLGSWLIADLIWAAYVVRGDSPFPSPADFFYLAGYPVLTAGLIVAVRQRAGDVDARAWLDAGIVAIIGGLFAWIFLVIPALDEPSITRWEAFVSVSYVLGDLLLLLVALRFVMSGNWHVRSLELLVLGLALTFAGDVLFQLSLGGTHTDLGSGDWLLQLGLVCVGAAGLHETMPALTEWSAGKARLRRGHVRVALLTAACLTPPLLLLVTWLADERLHTVAMLVATALISVLAVARSEVSARRAFKVAEREAVLVDYDGALVRAGDESEMYAIAARTAERLLDEGTATVVPTATAVTDRHAFSAPVEAAGEQVAVLVADADLPDIRRSQHALEHVANDLSLAVERARLRRSEQSALEKLSAQNDRLLELDKMKDQFVSTITHELRTPLSSMVGYLEMLSGSEVGELTPAERERFLEIVNRNCQRLNRLVDDILTVARIDSARFSLERKPVDIVQLAGERVESIRATAEQRLVDVELTVGRRPPPLEADPMRLGQLLDNLLSNAVKFSPEGGVVRLTVDLRGDKAHIEVADSGIGIPADELDKLFERFFRASTAATVQGTGLGLSIAKSIVEAHGGTITVQSGVGAGTTFSVDLPIEVAHETAGKASR